MHTRAALAHASLPNDGPPTCYTETPNVTLHLYEQVQNAHSPQIWGKFRLKEGKDWDPFSAIVE